jgi:hypothetical protein
MRIESSVTAISWIPSEAVQGLPKMPFSARVVHYDEPPPDAIDDIDAMREADAFREANELRAWIDVDDGKITDYGHKGRGHIGVTRVKVGLKEISVPAVALPTLRPEPEVGDGWVKFTQTAGGRTGMPAPRHVRGKPFFQINSAIAWTTLALTIRADGSSEHELVGASPFPRHWIYDKDGKLVQKSGLIDFKEWYRKAFGQNTPWGQEDSPAVVTEIESALERQLSRAIMGEAPKPFTIGEGETLVEQGEEVADSPQVYLLLDGVLTAEVDGEEVAEIGPGAIVGERALLEGGARTSTLRAATRCKVVAAPADKVDTAALAEVAAGHRREES